MVEKSIFGKYDEKDVFLFTITNSRGLIAKVTNYGAILVSLLVPDKIGNLKDVVLGFDSLEEYFSNPCYFGSTVGRNSNRIHNASFVLNGKTYYLDKNEKENNLHSGFSCYDKRFWDYKIDEILNSVSFHLLSPDKDQGFPGDFDITVTYTLTDDNELHIHYNGFSNQDTIANMTNHSYLNLGGHDCKTATNQELWIKANSFLTVDSESIPTGKMEDVSNSPMDFRTPKIIEKDIHEDYEQLLLTGGFDHSYVLEKEDPRN